MTADTAPLGRGPAGRVALGLLGATAVALGIVLIVRPTTSLGTMAWLLGIALIVQAGIELLSDRDTERRAVRIAAAILWAAAAIVVALSTRNAVTPP